MKNRNGVFKINLSLLISFVFFGMSPLICMDRKTEIDGSPTFFSSFTPLSDFSSEDSPLSDDFVSDYFESDKNLERMFQKGMRYTKENFDRERDDRYSKNDDFAIYYFQYAAERGHPYAQYNLAGMYIGKDDTLVIKWLTAAGMQGHSK